MPILSKSSTSSLPPISPSTSSNSSITASTFTESFSTNTSSNTISNSPKPFSPKAPVFLIRKTGEYFPSYEEYLERMSLYEREEWTCRLTGFTGLTWQAALDSENESLQILSSTFPSSLVSFCLGIIHYSSCSIEILTNEIQKQLKIMAENDSSLIIPPKTTIKKFIRYSSRRYGNSGSPWIVNEDLVRRFSLVVPSSVPESLILDVENHLKERQLKQKALVEVALFPSFPSPSTKGTTTTAKKVSLRFPTPDCLLPQPEGDFPIPLLVLESPKESLLGIYHFLLTHTSPLPIAYDHHQQFKSSTIRKGVPSTKSSLPSQFGPKGKSLLNWLNESTIDDIFKDHLGLFSYALLPKVLGHLLLEEKSKDSLNEEDIVLPSNDHNNIISIPTVTHIDNDESSPESPSLDLLKKIFFNLKIFIKENESSPLHYMVESPLLKEFITFYSLNQKINDKIILLLIVFLEDCWLTLKEMDYVDGDGDGDFVGEKIASSIEFIQEQRAIIREIEAARKRDFKKLKISEEELLEIEDDKDSKEKVKRTLINDEDRKKIRLLGKDIREGKELLKMANREYLRHSRIIKEHSHIRINCSGEDRKGRHYWCFGDVLVIYNNYNSTVSLYEGDELIAGVIEWLSPYGEKEGLLRKMLINEIG